MSLHWDIHATRMIIILINSCFNRGKPSLMIHPSKSARQALLIINSGPCDLIEGAVTISTCRSRQIWRRIHGSWSKRRLSHFSQPVQDELQRPMTSARKQIRRNLPNLTSRSFWDVTSTLKSVSHSIWNSLLLETATLDFPYRWFIKYDTQTSDL